MNTDNLYEEPPKFPVSNAPRGTFLFAQVSHGNNCHLSFNNENGQQINLQIDLRNAQAMLNNLTRVVALLSQTPA